MRTIIPWLVVGLICCHTPLHAQQLTAAEYFIDVDPGVGEGIPVSITAADQVDATFAADVSALPAGFHTLSTRFKNADAVWGQAVSRLFYVYGGTVIIGDPAPLTAGEYFIDLDPGMGQATAFAVTPGDQATATFGVDMSAVSVGFHTLSTRFKNTDGQWGHSISRLFYIYGGSGGNDPAAPLTAGEYFVDTDPGVGQAVAFAVTAGDQTSATFGVDVAAAGVGFHTLSMRFKNADGQWSQAISRLFYIYGGNVGAAANIVAAEYFVDTDPGAGNGTAIPTGAPQDTVNFNALIDVSALPIGEYVLFVRVKDADGVWSMAEARPFTICTFDGPVAAFDFVKDNMVVSFDNQSENQVSCSWAFGDGDTSNLNEPFHTYSEAGIYNVCLVAYNPCLVTGDTVCSTIIVNGVNGVTPDIGGNQGGVTVDVTGAGFSPATTFKLIRGQETVDPDTTYFINNTRLTISLDLLDVDTGFWDVQVVDDADTFLLADGFQVVGTPFSDSLLTVSLAGSRFLRPGFEFLYTVTCQNNSYNDAVAVPVWLAGLPMDCTVRVVNEETPLDSLDWIAALGLTWDSIPAFITDSATMEAFVGIIIPILRPQSSFTIQFAVKPSPDLPLGDTYALEAFIQAPLLSSDDLFRDNSSALNECMNGVVNLTVDLFVEGLGITELSNCFGVDYFFGDALKKLIRKTAGIQNPQDTQGPVRKIINNSRLTRSWFNRAANCAVALGGSTPIGGVAKASKFLLKAWKRSNQGFEAGWTVGACQQAWKNRGRSEQPTTVAISWDPNDKYGPGNQSTAHYVSGHDGYPYTIAFENDPAAQLPTQLVTVVDSLDPNVFDFSSFTFTFASIGYQRIELGSPTTSFVRDIDLEATMGVKTRVVGSFDETTGVVRWQFFTIDPLTGQATTDPLAGFLPPDTLSPLGQGYVGFIVNGASTLQEGDTIRNRATIIFDYNEPIITPVWQTVVDTAPPSSQVLALPATVTSDSVLVAWEGNDGLSGVYRYSVFVEPDGEGYYAWMANSSDTSAWFHGVVGSTYRFYSMATDSAGNVEEAPTHFDAETEFVIPGSGISELNDQEFGVALVPNPNQGRFELRLHSNQVRRSTIQITDMLGQPVHAEEAYIQPGRTVRAMDFPSIASGIYLITIHTEGRILKLRWVKN